MIKLYSILKSREITLSTKVRIVKAMVFLVVMYRCELDHKEGWVPKKWCFQTVVPEKILKSPVDSKETKPVSSKGNQPWRFIGRTDAEASMLGATMGDPNHDKVMWKRSDRQGFRTRGTPWAIPPMTRSCGRDLISKASGLNGPPGPAQASISKTRICLSYYFMSFTNSSDINRGLSPTTFFWKKLT